MVKWHLYCFFVCFLVSVVKSQLNERRITHQLPNRERRNENVRDETTNDNSILQRINEKLAALQALDEQQLKRLEALEYKITRFDVTNQERMESIRNDLRETSNRVQHLDWLTTKTEASLDQLKVDLDEMKQINSHNIGSEIRNTNSPIDFTEKLNALAILITSARSGIHRIERELSVSGHNMTFLMASNRELHQIQKNFPTKQFLNNAILGLKSQPIYAVMQNPPLGRNGLPSMIGDTTSSVPNSCSEVTSKKSGVYKIQVEGSLGAPFYVYCNMEEYDGGWTLIQSRNDGTVSFYRGWSEYKHGFGNLGGEFFIGLDKLHDITSSRIHELLIVMEDFSGDIKYAKYSSFAIGGEHENYALILLGTYNGTAGDSLSYHAGQKFSTSDMDNDSWPEGNCALAHVGGWWYNACDMSNLNGRYLSGEVLDEYVYQGIYWNDFHGRNYSLQSVKMMIRPVE